ncbi:MAG: hypothetical protein RIQ56_350 [Candidatus Parcubacteria bacterium]|jgi:predicted nucleotidyltransferase
MKRLKRKPSAKKPLDIMRVKNLVLPIARQYKVTNVRIFGSFARGEQNQKSDVDLLVDLPAKMTLLDLSGMKIDLEEALKRNVDVIPARSIKPLLRDRILAEARTL